MKGVIEEVFTSVLELLVEEGYVRLENYFVDGSKLEANANRHKVVWAKSRAKYQERLRKKVKELLKEIDAVNEAENEVYGDQDLEEMGGSGGIDAEKLEKKIAELNQRLKEKPEDKKLAKAVKVMYKDYLPRQRRYEEQERKLAGRSSYSKTDEDATFFRMKEDRGAEKPLPKPAYNVQPEQWAVCGRVQFTPASRRYHLSDPSPGGGQGQSERHRQAQARDTTTARPSAPLPAPEYLGRRWLWQRRELRLFRKASPGQLCQIQHLSSRTTKASQTGTGPQNSSSVLRTCPLLRPANSTTCSHKSSSPCSLFS